MNVAVAVGMGVKVAVAVGVAVDVGEGVDVGGGVPSGVFCRHEAQHVRSSVINPDLVYLPSKISGRKGCPHRSAKDSSR